MLHNENPELCWQKGCPEHEAPDWIKELVKERNVLKKQVEELTVGERSKMIHGTGPMAKHT